MILCPYEWTQRVRQLLFTSKAPWLGRPFSLVLATPFAGTRIINNHVLVQGTSGPNRTTCCDIRLAGCDLPEDRRTGRRGLARGWLRQRRSSQHPGALTDE